MHYVRAIIIFNIRMHVSLSLRKEQSSKWQNFNTEAYSYIKQYHSAACIRSIVLPQCSEPLNFSTLTLLPLSSMIHKLGEFRI